MKGLWKEEVEKGEKKLEAGTMQEKFVTMDDFG